MIPEKYNWITPGKTVFIRHGSIMPDKIIITEEVVEYTLEYNSIFAAKLKDYDLLFNCERLYKTFDNAMCDAQRNRKFLSQKTQKKG